MTVGRESAAHPAFRIIPSPDAERHHLKPSHGYQYRINRYAAGCVSLSRYDFCSLLTAPLIH
jgi:hypothetical protein